MKQEASPTHTQKTHFVLVSYSRALDLFWRWLIDAFHWRKLIFSSQQVSVANSSLARGKTLCTFLLRAEMKILFYSNRRITRILYFLGFFFLNYLATASKLVFFPKMVHISTRINKVF